jgi:hypothetical protein
MRAWDLLCQRALDWAKAVFLRAWGLDSRTIAARLSTPDRAVQEAAVRKWVERGQAFLRETLAT